MRRTLLRWFRGWLPSGWRLRRRVRLPVVADLIGSAQLWSLVVTRARGGTGGFVADPRMALQPDEAFEQSVAAAFAWAWARESFPRDLRRPWTITWCLYDPTGAPASGEVGGGSLGAALGIALAFLFGLGRAAKRRLDPDALLSAQLDEDGELLPVNGLETKVGAVSERRGARLLVAAPNEAAALDARSGEHPAIVAGSKAADAISFVAARRYRSVVATLVALLTVGSGVIWVDIQQAGAASADKVRLVQQLTARSRQSLQTDPATAALAAVAAVKLDPGDVGAQRSLLNATNVDSRFDGALGSATTDVTLSPDGTLLATGGQDHAITLWRLDHRQLVRAARAGGTAVTVLAFSADGRTVVSGDQHGQIVRWDVATLAPTILYRPDWAGADPIQAVAVSRDGARLAAADQGKQIRIFGPGALDPVTAPATVTSLAFSAPDTLLVGQIGPKVTNQLLAYDLSHLRQPPTAVFQGKATALVRGVTALAVSPDGQTVLSGDMGGQVVLWDAAQLTQRKSMGVGGTVLALSADITASTALVTTARGLGISTVLDRTTSATTTQLRDLATGEPKSAPLSGSFRTAMVTADRDLRTAVIRGPTGSATIWTDLDGNRLRQQGLVADVVPDPRNPGAVLTAGAAGRIDVVDVDSARIVQSLDSAGHGQLLALAASPSGQLLATGQSDGTVLLRDPRSGALVGPPLVTGDKSVYRLRFSPTGSHIATGGGDGIVRLWDVSTRQVSRQWTTGANTIGQVLFDATGQRVYVTELRSTGVSTRGGVWWASTDSNEIHDQKDLEFPVRGITQISPDRILIGDGNGTLWMTDQHLSRVPQEIPFRHKANVMALDHASNSAWVVTGGWDNTAAILRSDDLSLMLQLPGEDAVQNDKEPRNGAIYSAAVTRDGHYAVFGSDTGRIQIVPLDNSILIARACRFAGHPATANELGVTANEFTQLGAPC